MELVQYTENPPRVSETRLGGQPETSPGADVTARHARGRLYIPHGKSNEQLWSAHVTHVDPMYTQCGPDWSSRLRYIPPPRSDLPTSVEVFPTNWPEKRHFPWKAYKSRVEWALHPGNDRGPRTIWRGSHPGNSVSHSEITHSMLFGKGRSVTDISEMRNGIAMASPGDKPYQAPEYSSNFHRLGSTLPLANFGHLPKVMADTFVPLIAMPDQPTASYIVKERKRLLNVTIEEVMMLESWRPATPLTSQGHIKVNHEDALQLPAVSA